MEQRPGNNFRFDGPFYGREGYHDDSWWNGPLHAIVLLLLVALLVVAVVWLFRVSPQPLPLRPQSRPGFPLLGSRAIPPWQHCGCATQRVRSPATTT